MLFVRTAITALTIIGSTTAIVAPVFAQTCVCPSPEQGAISPNSVPYSGGQPPPLIYADEPPPPLPDYDRPPPAAAGYYWTPGYWAYNNVDYYWVPGVWVEPPQPGLLWTPGYWAFVGGIYAFHRGYWAHEVGFYGGVNYGFGYFGRGYDGGRWEGGNFFYNTAVNNIRTTNITTVYNKPVTVNNITNVSSVSYNGGPGGIVRKAHPRRAANRFAAAYRTNPTTEGSDPRRSHPSRAVRKHKSGQAANSCDRSPRRFQAQRGRAGQGCRNGATPVERSAFAKGRIKGTGEKARPRNRPATHGRDAGSAAPGQARPAGTKRRAEPGAETAADEA